ncbi:hypothetical protein [Mycobacterium attenuatum]|uniref:hypothetical protein n=1 Tax=Mycobacterium attenuatum TaxID=2341086 RepID=UPI000F03BC4E|nr:hypothetical protein [Mycobacterium attenuatum]VBA62383.1 hypothetical protein LAUMK41_05774 [Mycobacterium attenuatum]
MPDHIFDDQRRAWIAAHAGVFLFQKRRAELLGKRLRAANRNRTGARPDPHDDQVTAPLLLRTASTPTGSLETAIAVIAALAAPIGWPAGRLLYEWITRRLIPDNLRAYPIPALVWGAIICGAPLLLLDPSPSLWSSLVVPWLGAQLPAILLAAGMYGILEGWLAVDGSSHWWPMAPKEPDIDDRLLLGPMESTMPTLLDPAPVKRRPAALTARRTPPKVTWLPLVSGLILAGAGTLWFTAEVIEATVGNADSAISSTDDRNSFDTTAN